MPVSYLDVNVKCPFFRFAEDSIRRISCEGITDASTLSQTFVSKEDYLREIEIHCASRYTYCELYNAIMEAKYLDN